MPTHDIIDNRTERMAGMKELRLLLGNTTNRGTFEQLAEGYRCLEMVAEEIEKQNYPKRAHTKKMADTTAEKTSVPR